MKKKGEFECLPLNSLFCLKGSVANNIKSNVINNKYDLRSYRACDHGATALRPSC